MLVPFAHVETKARSESQAKKKVEELKRQGKSAWYDETTLVVFSSNKRGRKPGQKKVVILSRPVKNDMKRIPLRVKLRRIFKLSLFTVLMWGWYIWIVNVYEKDPIVMAKTYNTAEWFGAITTDIVSNSTSNHVLIETKKTESNDIHSVIERASKEYGIDTGLMLRIAKCESGYNPNAKNRNSSASGLFQHINATWIGHRKKMGLDTSLNLRFDAYESARTAAWSISQGGLRNWDASRSCWQ